MKYQHIKSIPFERSRAFYVIERNGQQPPDQGDFVQCVAQIFLPAESNPSFHHPVISAPIKFGSRLAIADEHLNAYWGIDRGDYRMRTREFAAPTWREAFQQAENWAISELEKLEQALEAREEALRKAEEE